MAKPKRKFHSTYRGFDIYHEASVKRRPWTVSIPEHGRYASKPTLEACHSMIDIITGNADNDYQPTRAQRIAQRAAELLDAGTLASALPGRLMAEFGLTPAQARRAAEAALKRRAKEQ